MTVAAVIALAVGLLLLLLSRRRRDGQTLELDSRTLRSARFGLSGRPDRLFRDGEAIIPEEWKSSRRVYDNHRAQLAVYFILVEEEYGIQPPYGVIVTGDGQRHRVENDPRLREWVLGVANQIRRARRAADRPIPVRQKAAKCRSCGMKDGCGLKQTNIYKD